MLNPELLTTLQANYNKGLCGELSQVEIASIMGVSKTTVYRKFKEFAFEQAI